MRSRQVALKQAGFRVRTVSDGEAALAAIAEDPPDLVLLDVMIPGRDGYAVCQGIRANQWKILRTAFPEGLSGSRQRKERKGRSGGKFGAMEAVTGVGDALDLGRELT